LLAEAAKAASNTFGNHNERRKAIEARQKEIAELQKQIGAYGKTREVYREYRALPSKKRAAFFEEHRDAITIHRAAKEYFDSLGYGRDKKLPPMQALRQEYAILETERKILSRNYRAERDEMIALQMAKQNVDGILGEPRRKARLHEHDAR
jgi:chromosome segregation ATPase